MRAYPIAYLTLLAACGIFFIGGLIGAQPSDPSSAVSVQDAAFYLSFVPVSFGIAGVLTLVFWLLGLVHALRNPALIGTDKVVWILVLILLNGLGAVLYFFIAPNPVDPRARLS
jgi:hypothetical protein